MKIFKNLFRVAGAIVLGFGVASGAQAVPFYWTDWTGTDLLPGTPFQAQGTITTTSSSVTVTYTNQNGVGFYQPSGGIDYWANGSGSIGGRDDAISPYTSTLVDNAPMGTDIIALSKAGSQTLSFSEIITNPVFAFNSLNFNGYAFDQDFEILSIGGVDGNACGYWGCGGISKVVVDLGGGNFEYQLNSNNIGGSEPHGTIRFVDSFDTLTWRSSTDEYWNGFTVGVQGTAVEVCTLNPSLPECQSVSTPEPASVLLYILGLVMLGMTRRRMVLAEFKS